MNNFDDLMLLLRLVTDPAATQARLDELQAAIQAAVSKEAEADAARAALEGDRERLAKLEASLRERELAVFASEQKHGGELEALERWKRENGPLSRLIHLPGGLTQERDDTVERALDPISDPYAETMDLNTVAPAAHKTMRRMRG